MEKICPGGSQEVCDQVRNLFQYLDPSREVRQYHSRSGWYKLGECGHTRHSGRFMRGRGHVAGIGYEALNDPIYADGIDPVDQLDPADINRNEDGCTYAYCAKRV